MTVLLAHACFCFFIILPIFFPIPTGGSVESTTGQALHSFIVHAVSLLVLSVCFIFTHICFSPSRLFCYLSPIWPLPISFVLSTVSI
ncbi:hypothetical protein FPQ18DRAFT_344038 [Pyronema domesticum]|nr:hypothetical protein FPQ18DRAFT_344038 [Pyronema domesticum]